MHTYCTQSGDENASFHKNDSLRNLYVETNLLKPINFYMLFTHEWLKHERYIHTSNWFENKTGDEKRINER